MALRQGHFSFTIEDGLATDASNVFYTNIDDTTTVAGLLTAQNALGALLEPLTSGQIVKSKVSINNPQTYAAPSGKADSRVEETGNFNFANSLNNRSFGTIISAFDDAHLSGGKIDPTNADVAAFVALMVNATAYTTGTYTTNYFTNLHALVDTFLSFRKHRRQLQRSSRDVI